MATIAVLVYLFNIVLSAIFKQESLVAYLSGLGGYFAGFTRVMSKCAALDVDNELIWIVSWAIATISVVSVNVVILHLYLSAVIGLFENSL